MSKRIAIIGAVLENPKISQDQFNTVVSNFKGIVKGRMGLPMPEAGVSVISITILATLDEINNLTGRLGNIKDVTVKTSISKKEIVV
ncbi:iron-only hydrogenase system regulator [Clostridium sp. 'deep sea']|jgi:putative iron-only hydrogenase system regulator|uniref:TM1266 family iron-only hydrogenase system putative regulator n=1 Tax=Clostridium sp. 'deep sea' TaxID=2779445 RepID=UPI001896683E|nr:TM1266 family iron-only hydrogenase system putative regulator [Clostridium sp. 'deep sea']QOR33798.1 iron-only hydrogenase system regulator [Clostridium sp. 'deep sea']